MNEPLKKLATRASETSGRNSKKRRPSNPNKSSDTENITLLPIQTAPPQQRQALLAECVVTNHQDTTTELLRVRGASKSLIWSRNEVGARTEPCGTPAFIEGISVYAETHQTRNSSTKHTIEGFFRRSIQKQIEYRCLRDGKCLVIRLNRNRCQYCRFKKCISVGMSRDSVRYGRVPKRSREMSADEPPKVTISDADQSDSETKQLAVYEVILTVSQAHHANCGYTEEHTKTLVRRPIVLPPASPQPDRGAASSTAEALELERVRLWQEFAARITPSVQRLVEFAKRLPGFFDLCQDDQLILIKLGFFEIWLCHAARLAAGSAPVVFDDGAAVSKQQLEILYDSEFASAVIHFTNAFNALSLNDTEVGLLSAVVLFTADRSGTTDIKLIEHQRDKLIEALKVQVGRNHASKPQIFSNMLILIPELRNLGSKHLAHLNWLRVNMEKIVLPPLFVEIFDIRNHDELQ